MNATIENPAFFKLKDAREYKFYNRLGRRMTTIMADEVVTVTAKEDVLYFRARPDVLVECNEDGIPLIDVGRIGHYVPGKSKSFKVYGRKAARKATAPQPAPPVAARTLAVGRVPAPVAQPPAPRPAPVARSSHDRMSPIEEVASDGSTRAVRPVVDPGM